jgi:hypothetical protein
LKRLEPDEGKLSSPVLRGGNGGNVVSLPDNQDGDSLEVELAKRLIA